jgi:hypothetical protein
MPIEIRELVIRAVAVRTEDKDGAQVSKAARAARAVAPATDHERVVQDCVQEVMRILRKSEER